MNRGVRAIVLGAGVIGAFAAGMATTGAAMNLLNPPPPAALGPPRFVEEARAAGIEHRYDGGPDFFVGGGVAVLDCDDDGRPDLYFAGGTNPAALYRNASPTGGALRFERLADPVTDLVRVTGAYPIDVDGDRRPDLVVIRHGENVILRGLGDCRFERANETLAFDGGDAWTTAFSATWERPDGLPTLAFGNYTDPASRDTGHLCLDDVLVRPAASGDGYDGPIPLTPSWCALSMLFSDWDRSGRADLRISNDRQYYRADGDGQEQLWRIAPGATPRLYASSDGWGRLQIFGMGIASYDVTGDGYPEVYLTNMSDNKLQTLATGPARPDYRDIGLRRGVSAHRPFTGPDQELSSTAWHAEFQDVNNDGFIDLFVAKGNVDEVPNFATRDPSNLLIGQPDGTFVEGAMDAGILSFARGRGAALADFNLDGLLDLVEVNRGDDVTLWRSLGSGDAARSGPMGHWIAVQLVDPGLNRDAIGAWLEVRIGDRIIEREVTVGGGHAGGQLGWIHVGLGGADRAELRVRWPDGETGPWLPVPADGFAFVERDASGVRSWRPPGG